MKTTVVCGLLGSGKTTFVKSRIQNAAERTVVLVNDFGAAGIDGEILSAAGIESVELPSGCVCCTLKLDLITTIRRILREFRPEHLMIEPSGVASPAGVLEALESAGIHGYAVVGIVDATEFAELYESGMYGSFFRDQIALSDIILVNKVDLADEQEVLEAEKLIEATNPRAVVFRTKNAMLFQPLSPPLHGQEKRAGKDPAEIGILSLPLPERVAGRRGGSHFDFETLSFKLDGHIRLTAFSNFFESLVQGRYGAVARIKALLNTDQGSYRFDGVFGKMDMVRFEKDIEEGRLVVIGNGLDKHEIEKSLRA